MSEKTSIVARVRGLVALAASSTFVNEASTAALEACRLIHEHALEVQERVVQEVVEDAKARVETELRKPPRERKAVRSVAEDVARAAAGTLGREVGRETGKAVSRLLRGIGRRKR